MAERRAKDPDIRKKELLEIACDFFQKKGFLATSIQDIVKAAGLSQGAFFYHFPTKNDVLVSLARMRLEAFHVRLVEWTNDERLSAREKINNILDEVSSLRQMRVALDHLGLGFARQDPEIHNAVMNVALPMLIDDIERLIVCGVEQGDFHVHDPRVTALLLLQLSGDMIHRADVVGTIVDSSRLLLGFRDTVHGVLGLRQQPPTGGIRPRT